MQMQNVIARTYVNKLIIHGESQCFNNNPDFLNIDRDFGSVNIP